MPLEVQIEKKLADFTLDLKFRAADAPLSVLGASGAGKTMLLRCIAGLERPGRGHISLNERILFDSEKKIAVPARDRRIGLLFQNYALFPHRTVAENIAFGLQSLATAERTARIKSLIASTHLTGLDQRYPRELSGGEQQRAAMARALAIEPEALLLDEPLAALDTHLRAQVEAQLQETFNTYRRPVLLVTHNIEEAYRLGEQLLVLSRGRITAFGAKEEIFRQPAKCRSRAPHGVQEYFPCARECGWHCRSARLGLPSARTDCKRQNAQIHWNPRASRQFPGFFRGAGHRGKYFSVLASSNFGNAVSHHTISQLAPRSRHISPASGGL